MMDHTVGRTLASLLLSFGLLACGSGGGSSDGGSSGVSDDGSPASLDDSGTPVIPGEMSNAGDSTLTDGDPDAGTPDVAPSDNALSGGMNSVAQIAGLWDDSYAYPDGRVNITYLEITADGRYINHDYRGDSFDTGLNCYETIEGVITAEADGGYKAVILGDTFLFEASAVAGQLQVSFAGGGTTSLSAVTGLSTIDFNEC